MSLLLAIRNVFRNKRRSVVTVLAIALSCAGLVLFGGYVAWAHLASETHMVNMTGHLQLFRQGYRTKGGGNPAACAITNFDEVKSMLLRDEVIGPRLDMVTGQLLVQGMVNCGDRQTSTTFLGIGAVPEDFERLSLWNPHGLSDSRELAANAELYATGPELDAADPEGITLGVGLGRILEIPRPAPGRAVVFLLRHQNEDGGWGETTAADQDIERAGQGASTPLHTAHIISSLLRAGLPVDDPVVLGALRFLLARISCDGYWGDRQSTFTLLPAVPTTAMISSTWCSLWTHSMTSCKRAKREMARERMFGLTGALAVWHVMRLVQGLG